MRGIQSMLCPFEETCEQKSDNCMELTMEKVKAKEILKDKFWIVEQGGLRIGTLRKSEDNKFVLSNKNGHQIFKNAKSLKDQFGSEFFVAKILKDADATGEKEVHGYPTSWVPHNPLYDIQKKLPLFTKSSDSKSLYCAGYYVIKFNKGWVKSFCPKLITLQRYEFKGPFKTDLEMKQVLSNVSK